MNVRISADLNTLKEIKTFLEGISQSIENIPEDCTHLEYQTADKMVIFDNPIFPESLCRRTQEYSPKK